MRSWSDKIYVLPKIDRKLVSALDLPGLLLGPLAFVALTYGIAEGARSWASAPTIACFIFGVVLLLVFIMVELRTAQPHQAWMDMFLEGAVGGSCQRVTTIRRKCQNTRNVNSWGLVYLVTIMNSSLFKPVGIIAILLIV
jgi:uncharacterized membrane protein